jgi:predicted dehydrogenase
VPVAVAAHGSDPIGSGKACVAHLTVQLSNGAIAHVHVNWLSPTKIRTMVIGGSSHTVVWDDLNPSQRLSIYDRGVDPATSAADSRARAMVSYRIGDMVAPALPEREALRGVMSEFAESIAQRRSPLTDGWSGVRVLAVLEAASASLSQGGAFMPVLGVDDDNPADLLAGEQEGTRA